jgi:hypothetical protein
MSGRLGNSLFQIASCCGIAKEHNAEYGFPEWAYEKYFENPLPKITGRFTEVKEAGYHYTPFVLNSDTNIRGWLQTEKYWENHKAEVLAQMKFKADFIESVKAKLPVDETRQTIGISIRRGDFVGNPNYYQLPITYYILALIENFPDWEKYNIVFFSDDIGYCKVNFECMHNAYFAENMTDIEQLCLMSQICDHYIISNSTFSRWGAYLGENRIDKFTTKVDNFEVTIESGLEARKFIGKETKVIRPFKNLAGNLENQNSEKDYWPERWTVFEHEGKKIDLSKFTFTIPVFMDHHDRKQNLELSVCLLQRFFETKIIIGEQGAKKFKYMEQYTNYHYFDNMAVFHRTKMLNEMCRMADTPYVVNYDCDVILPPMQMYMALKALENGADMVYPYDGRFARVPRVQWFHKIEEFLDIGIIGDTILFGKNQKPMPVSSVGGCVIVNVKSFIDSGMENEHMVSYAPEDCERWDRWHKLEYKVERIKGTLYHIDHFIGINSNTKHPFYKRSKEELHLIRAMTKQQLREYVDKWQQKNSM